MPVREVPQFQPLCSIHMLLRGETPTRADAGTTQLVHAEFGLHQDAGQGDSVSCGWGSVLQAPSLV